MTTHSNSRSKPIASTPRADRVLQHLDSPTAAIEELRRVTRPGGWVGVSDTDQETIFIDTPNGHTERFLSVEHAPNRNPTIGRQLLRLAQEAGLRDVEVHPIVAHVTDYALLKQAVLLADWTEAMIEQKEVTAAEDEAWKAGLRAADESDRLFAGATVYTVAKRVPGRE